MRTILFKTSITFSISFLIFLSSCTTIEATTVNLQESTRIEENSSPQPLETSSLEPTSTATQLPNPDYMGAYVEGGL